MPSSPLPARALRGIQPVVQLPADPAKSPSGVGLCLSGGGYRAMLYHLGALWRLNEAGLLRGLERISSVSGGSITAGVLGLHWRGLDWRDGVAENLETLVVDPVRSLARETIDVSSVVEGALPWTSVGRRVAAAYRQHLFGDATLQDLPADADGPRFVICATNMESGVLFRFSRPYLADYRVGRVMEPDTSLADAVAASSAFPPVLSPFEIDLRHATWQTEKGNKLVHPDYRGKIALSDGGVYDNLGLETVWKACGAVLISDGGGHIADDDDPHKDWPRHTLRVLNVIDGQVRALRKRQAFGSYALGLRTGAYWGIRPDPERHPFPGELAVADAEAMAAIPTRLRKLDETTQERLVNWGYASSDAALRHWYVKDAPGPAGLPYPAAG